jgi:hypothetical protein
VGVERMKIIVSIHGMVVLHLLMNHIVPHHMMCTEAHTIYHTWIKCTADGAAVVASHLGVTSRLLAREC